MRFAGLSLGFRHPPGRGGADPEPGREAGERLAFPQVDQDKEGLLGGVQLPPARADRGTVAADDPGHEGEGPGRQRQRGTVERHRSPGESEAGLGRPPHLPGLLQSQQRHAAQ
jgi:hypothetical protein